MPAIVGLIKLELPITRKLADTLQEQIRHVGFDADGQAWGLVQQALQIMPSETSERGVIHGGVWRVDFVRWVRFNAIPFVADELVEPGANGWKSVSRV